MKFKARFNRELIGSIPISPGTSIKVHVVRPKQPWHAPGHVDLRKFVVLNYRGKKVEGPSKRGITLSRDVAVEVYNKISAIPEEIDPRDKEYVELAEIEKNPETKIKIGIGKLPLDSWGLDIRDYKTEKRYTGFTPQGVRVPLDYVDDLAKILFEAFSSIKGKRQRKAR